MIDNVDKMRFLASIAGDKRLNAADLRCAFTIVDLYNSKKGRAWPSWTYLMNATGLARASIGRSVKKLDKLGLIKKERGGKGRSNSYRPAWRPPRVKQDENIPLASETVSPATPQPSHAGDHPGLSSETQSYHHPSEYQTKKGGGEGSTSGGASPCGERPAGGDPGFNEWFAAYPKREARAKAAAQYAEAVRSGVTPAELLRGAKQYAAAKANVQPQYLKMPANWLREQCWLEDPQPPRAKASHVAPRARQNTKAAKAGKKNKTTPARLPVADETEAKKQHQLDARWKNARAIGTAVHSKHGAVEILDSAGSLSGEDEPTIYVRAGDGKILTDQVPCKHLTARHMDEIVKDEADGKITSTAAQLEVSGFGVVSWTGSNHAQQSYHGAKRRLHAARSAVIPEAIPAPSSLSPAEHDFG